MTFLNKVIVMLSDSLGEVALSLNSRYVVPKYPRLFVLSSLLTSTIISNFYLPALFALPFSFPVLIDKKLRKVLLYVTGFSLIVALPVLINDVTRALDFVIRVYSASAFFVFLIKMVGWEGFVRSLGALGLPDEIVLALRMLPYHLYTALRDLNILVLARRARTFKEDLKETWWLLATSVGILMVRRTRKAQAVALAFKMRGIHTHSSNASSIPTLISLIACGVSVLALLGGRVV